MNARDERQRRTLTVTRACHSAIAVSIAVSIVIQVVLIVTGGTDANSGETGESASLTSRLIRLFLFFTIDSNIVVMIVCMSVIVNPLRRGGIWWESLRLNALVAITVTGVVYAVLLAPHIEVDGWAQVTMIGLHVVSPLGFVTAWLIFGPRPRFRPVTIPVAFVLPVLWVIVTFLRGTLTGWYPYPFLDALALGFPTAVLNSLLILLAAAVLAIVLVLIDRAVPSLLRDERRAVD